MRGRGFRRAEPGTEMVPTFATETSAPDGMAGTPAGVRDSRALRSGGVAPLNHRLQAGIPPGWNGGETIKWQRVRMRMTMIFKREGTRAGGEWPGRRCGGGGWGPARALICGWQPIKRNEYGRFPENRVVSG